MIEVSQDQLAHSKSCTDLEAELLREREKRRDSEAAALLVQAELDETCRLRANLEQLVSTQTERLTDQVEGWQERAQIAEKKMQQLVSTQTERLTDQVESWQERAQIAEKKMRALAEQFDKQQHTDAVTFAEKVVMVQKSARANERWQYLVLARQRGQALVESKQQLLFHQQALNIAEMERHAATQQVSDYKNRLEALQREFQAKGEQMVVQPAAANFASEHTLQRVALKLAEELQSARNQLAGLEMQPQVPHH